MAWKCIIASAGGIQAQKVSEPVELCWTLVLIFPTVYDIERYLEIQRTMVNARRLSHLARRLHARLHHSQLYGTSIKSSNPSGHEPPFSLQLIVPPSGQVKTILFDDTAALDKFINSYNGSLRAAAPNGNERIITPKRYKDLSTSQIYEIVSPFFLTTQNERQHSQISNKAFEAKSRQAMIDYLNNSGLEFHELDRVIKDGDTSVAEWEGVFELDNRVYFLECKHRITAVHSPSTLALTLH